MTYPGQMVIEYAQAAKFLQGLRLRTFGQAMVALESVLKATTVVSVARELHFDQREELSRLSVVFDFDAYVETVINLVGEMFPLNEEATWESFFNDDGQFYLYFLPQGMNWLSEEDLWELFGYPQSYSREIALEAFILYLNMIGNFEEEHWEMANAHFGWGVDYPLETLSKDVTLDQERLVEMLREEGMEAFESSLHVACLEEDNVFFAYNPNDYDSEDMAFDAENIRVLAKEWQAAKKILEGHARAVQMTQRDPGLYRKFLDCWRRSLKMRNKWN